MGVSHRDRLGRAVGIEHTVLVRRESPARRTPRDMTRQIGPAWWQQQRTHWLAYGGRGDGLRSRTCDWGPGITRARVIGAPGTRTCPTDFSVWLPTYRKSSGTVFSFGGGISCWMHGIEQNITATSPKSVAASP